VVREIEQTSADVVAFVDDNFAHDPDRVGEICDLIVARGVRKRFLVQARVEIARRPDVLAKMEAAGFAAMFLGVESTQDRTLRSIRKGFDTRRLREYFRVLRRSRMLLIGFFIIGNIGESEQEMHRIASFAHELGLDLISLMRLENYRYTGLEELVALNPGHHIAPDGKIYSDALSPSDLNRVRREVIRRFFTLGHALRVVRKAVKNRLLRPRTLARLPLVLARAALGRL
jgi:hypothetical protein